MLDTTKLRKEWRGTGMYKIIADTCYSGGEPVVEDVADFFISRFESHQSLNVGEWEDEIQHVVTFIELYPTHWNGKPFMLPAGWSRKVGVEIGRKIRKLLDQKTKSLLEEVEGLRRHTKSQIPDQNGMLGEALEAGDIPTIVWHYQNTLTDTHNQCIDDIKALLTKNLKK